MCVFSTIFVNISSEITYLSDCTSAKGKIITLIIYPRKIYKNIINKISHTKYTDKTMAVSL